MTGLPRLDEGSILALPACSLPDLYEEWIMAMPPVHDSVAIRFQARRVIDSLEERITNDSTAIDVLPAMLLAQAAIIAPHASLGSCAQDGTDLLYAGRADGLYVCCGGNPQHCWRVAQ